MDLLRAQRSLNGANLGIGTGIDTEIMNGIVIGTVTKTGGTKSLPRAPDLGITVQIVVGRGKFALIHVT